MALPETQKLIHIGVLHEEMQESHSVRRLASNICFGCLDDYDRFYSLSI
jgi:hypothetical protein